MVFQWGAGKIPPPFLMNIRASHTKGGPLHEQENT
jgi:hypothetical protein